jgi:hypothetical protein
VPDTTDRGPFETEDQARMTPAVRAVWETMGTTTRRGVMDELNLAMLDEACAQAGIEAGGYGHRILAWVANMEPQTCVVFADLIVRAHEAGKAAVMEGAVTEWGLSYIHHPNVTGLPARSVFEHYPNEATAREAAATLRGERPEIELQLHRREVGPWKEVPETGEESDHGRRA